MDPPSDNVSLPVLCSSNNPQDVISLGYLILDSSTRTLKNGASQERDSINQIINLQSVRYNSGPLKKHVEVAGLLVTKSTDTLSLVTLGLLLMNRIWKGGTKERLVVIVLVHNNEVCTTSILAKASFIVRCALA